MSDTIIRREVSAVLPSPSSVSLGERRGTGLAALASSLASAFVPGVARGSPCLRPQPSYQ